MIIFAIQNRILLHRIFPRSGVLQDVGRDARERRAAAAREAHEDAVARRAGENAVDPRDEDLCRDEFHSSIRHMDTHFSISDLKQSVLGCIEANRFDQTRL